MTDPQPWWDWGIFQYRNIYKQTNGAGGAIILDFTPAVGQTMVPIMGQALNSGTNTAQIRVTDEDNNLVNFLAAVASAAGTVASFPQTNSQATASSQNIDSSRPLFIRNGDKLTLQNSGAGAQNDTLTVVLRVFISSATKPTRSVARSTNAADVDGIGVTDGTEGTPTLNVIR